jgi:hypothetical protein
MRKIIDDKTNDMDILSWAMVLHTSKLMSMDGELYAHLWRSRISTAYETDDGRQIAPRPDGDRGGHYLVYADTGETWYKSPRALAEPSLTSIKTVMYKYLNSQNYKSVKDYLENPVYPRKKDPNTGRGDHSVFENRYLDDAEAWALIHCPFLDREKDQRTLHIDEPMPLPNGRIYYIAPVLYVPPDVHPDDEPYLRGYYSRVRYAYDRETGQRLERRPEEYAVLDFETRGSRTIDDDRILGIRLSRFLRSHPDHDRDYVIDMR